jgi:hypothetical protein
VWPKLPGTQIDGSRLIVVSRSVSVSVSSAAVAGNLSVAARCSLHGTSRREEAGSRSHELTRYLISFDDGAMTFPEEDLPDVAETSKVVHEAKDAGLWIFGSGLLSQSASVVATNGTVTNGPYPETKAVIGRFSIIDVLSREEALEWAAKIAVACQCAQEVREIMYDPDS